MATSEIEKLERRYAENPHGLTFAPLAEVHRKNGDIARALELLTAGLELHPNYIPASIVLGRCHQDVGDLPAAESAFAHVLRLDDENVIALKSLADINERLEHYDLAENWLRRLVLVDRSNEEAKEQLHRIETARRSQSARAGKKEAAKEEKPEASPEPVAPAAERGDPAPASLPEDMVTLELTPRIAAAAPADDKLRSPPKELEIRPAVAALPDVVGLARKEPPAAEPPTPAPNEEPAASDHAVEPLPGLISAEFQPPLQATGGLGVETSEDVVLEVSGNSEFRVPDASEDLKSLAARLNAPPARPDVEPVEARESLTAARGSPPKAPSEPDFVVTETMAEVLLQQGHTEEAIRVYRELLRRSGGDARLELRLSEVESAARQQPPKQRSYLARDTNGQSVASFFHTLLAARPPVQPSSGTGPGDVSSRAGAASATPSPNGGSLASGSAEPGVPQPPAVPLGDPNADAAVSFDDFFSPEPDGSSSLQPGKSEPGGDDLDQFQSWLQNLKR